ncbi:MAG: 2'-5' RNA ligase [Methanosphaera sp. rholeuAM270]|nr:MAG: 2'-5' RNA ligase [Methanosphaera sp. rholeuAM270]
MRVFLAIEIDDYIKNKIDETQHIIRENNSANIKYVEKENIHLTIKFFGEINDKQIGNISEIVQSTVEKYEEYSLKVVNIGAFPNIYRPRVIWTAVKDKNVSMNLIKELDEKFNKIGFKKEKDYVPHITIGRVKDIADKDVLTNTLKSLKKEYYGKMKVEKICLKSSRLTPEGPIYENIREFKLGDKL